MRFCTRGTSHQEHVAWPALKDMGTFSVLGIQVHLEFSFREGLGNQSPRLVDYRKLVSNWPLGIKNIHVCDMDVMPGNNGPLSTMTLMLKRPNSDST